MNTKHLPTRRSALALIACTIGLALAGCKDRTAQPSPSQTQASPAKVDPQFEAVRAAFVPAGYYLPFLIVQHQQLLQKRGYKMELQRYQDNTHMVNLFLNGHLDVTAQSSFTMFPTEVNHPGILKFVYGQYASSYFFMVPKDSPIKSLTDLKGKKIGTWKSPTAMNFIQILLGKAGLKYSEDGEKDFQIARYGATEWPSALENGVVPAVYGFDVLLARLATTGNYRFVEKESSNELLPDSKVFNGGAFISQKLIDDNPKKAQAIREAFTEAIMIIREKPDLTAQIAAETLLPAEVSIEERRAIAKEAAFDEFTLVDDALLQSADATLELLATEGVVTKRFDARKLFWATSKP